MITTDAIPRMEYGLKFEEFDRAASRSGFIGLRAALPRPVSQQSAEGVRLNLEQLLETEMDLTRAEDGAYASDDQSFGTFNYSTEERGLETPLDERRVKRYRDIIDCEAAAVGSQHDRLARKHETQVRNLLYGGDTWPTIGDSDYATSLEVPWDSHDDASPVDDIENARLAITDMCGVEPNCLILNRRQFHHLRETDDIKDRVKYSGEGATRKSLSPAAVADLLGVKHLLVASCYKNIASRGVDAEIYPIWDDGFAMLCIVAENMLMDPVCIARTYMWTDENAAAAWSGSKDLAVIVEQYRNEKLRADVIRSRADWGIQLMHKPAGHLLRNVLVG